jgi:4-hydroxy-2-oxoheptanedioate aldolase
MELERNPFEAALKAGDKQLGLWISLCSGFGAEVTAPAGFDWALIDMEHSPNDYHSVLAQLQVFASYGTTAIVRPDWNDTVVVKRLMDLGVQGLLFPMIQSVEEAQKAVAATRYPPHGMRGVSGNTRANKFGRVSDYLARVDAETTVILQLETASAVAQAEAIGAVDGVSGVFFGPADIAADIGLVGQPMNLAVWDLIRPAAKALMAKGVPVGTLVMDPDFAADLLNEGFTFVACGSDTGLLAKASDTLLSAVKNKLEG